MLTIFGVLWFLLSLLIGSLNDILMQTLGGTYSSAQVTFLRFFWGTLTLLPFMVLEWPQRFRTRRMPLHALRACLLFGAMSLWAFSLNWVSVPTATVITFTIPFFTLILAFFLLHERVDWRRWLATVLGLMGAAIALNPSGGFQLEASGLLVATLFFALLDILNKKYAIQEPMLPMLFYSNLIVLALSALPALFFWQSLTTKDHALFCLLGCGSNGILYALIKAFQKAEISILAPLRYLELLFSTGLSYLLLKVLPPHSTWYAALLIIPSSFFVLYTVVQRKAKG